VCGDQGGICKVNTFFNPVACCFLYKAKDLSAPLVVNGNIDHLYTRLGTTRNYRATATPYNSQIITNHAKPFPACCVFTSRSLVTASNSGYSSASRDQALSFIASRAELPLNPKSKSKLCYDRRSVSQSVLE
jgi:hypothetical protein